MTIKSGFYVMTPYKPPNQTARPDPMMTLCLLGRED